MADEPQGNVRFLEKALTQPSLYGGTDPRFTKHGNLMLFGFGVTSKWAVLIKYQFDGEEDGDVELGTLVNITLTSGVVVPGFEIARSAVRTGEPGDYIEATPALRSNYEIRWEPGEWNAIDLAVYEVTTEDMVDGRQNGTIRQAERFSFQGQPLIAEAQEADPMNWPRVPGSSQASTAYPAATYDGDPLRGRFLVIIPVYESGYDPNVLFESGEHAYPGPRNEATGWQSPLLEIV